MFNKFIQSQKSKFVISIFMAILSGGMVVGCQSLESDNKTDKINETLSGKAKLPKPRVIDISQNPNQPVSKYDDMVMCTMQYDPVCAIVEVDGKKKQQQFGNSCSMGNFRDGKIISSSRGECQ